MQPSILNMMELYTTAVASYGRSKIWLLPIPNVEIVTNTTNPITSNLGTNKKQ
jgi:hypothetical protein